MHQAASLEYYAQFCSTHENTDGCFLAFQWSILYLHFNPLTTNVFQKIVNVIFIFEQSIIHDVFYQRKAFGKIVIRIHDSAIYYTHKYAQHFYWLLHIICCYISDVLFCTHLAELWLVQVKHGVIHDYNMSRSSYMLIHILIFVVCGFRKK